MICRWDLSGILVGCQRSFGGILVGCQCDIGGMSMGYRESHRGFAECQWDVVKISMGVTEGNMVSMEYRLCGQGHLHCRVNGHRGCLQCALPCVSRVHIDSAGIFI